MMCREILSPIHEDLAVSSGLDASDVWRCAGHGLYVQLPRTLSSTGGEQLNKNCVAHMLQNKNSNKYIVFALKMARKSQTFRDCCLFFSVCR